MNINTSSYSSTLAQLPTGDRIGIGMLKKTLDVQEQSAMALIASVPEAPKAAPAPDPSARVGGNINVMA